MTYYVPVVIDNNYLAWGQSQNYRPDALREADNSPNSLISPLLNAESRELGGYQDFLGQWFRQAPEQNGGTGYDQYSIHNIFTAEKMMYYLHLKEEYYGGGAASSDKNVLYAGGNTWFAASQMVNHLQSPATFHINSTYADLGLGAYFDGSTNVFRYNGPIEAGTTYDFIIQNNGGTTVASTLNGQIPEIETSVGSAAPTLSSVQVLALPTCSLYIANAPYTATLTLHYSNGVNYAYSVPLYVYNVGGPHINIVNDSDPVGTPFSDEKCEGESVILHANQSNGNYHWVVDGIISPNGNSSNEYFYANTPGTHTYQIYDSGNILYSPETITVTIHSNPNVFIFSDCSGAPDYTITAITLGKGASGANSYKWSTGDITPSITIDDLDYALSGQDNYEVTVTNIASGCTRTEKYKARNAPATGSIANIQVQNYNCIGGTITNGSVTVTILDPDAVGYTGVISPGGQFIDFNPLTRTFSGLLPGNYMIYIMPNYGNGCGFSQAFTVGTNAPIVATPTITNASNCQPSNGMNFNNNGAITLNVAGNNTFHWWPFEQNTQNISNLYPGSYRVDITDQNGCQQFYVFNVGYNYADKVRIKKVSAHDYDNTCTLPNGYVNINYGWGYEGGNGTDYDILYNNLGGGIAACTTGTVLSCQANNLTVGNYMVTVIDPISGCFDEFDFYIGNVLSLDFMYEEEASCVNNPNGTIMLTVCGGREPYYFNLSPVAGTVTADGFENVPPGTYDLTVTDFCGTQVVKQVVINGVDCCTSAGVTTTIPPSGLVVNSATPNISGLTLTFTGETIEVNGNIEIQNGYYLVLNNCTLKIATGKDITVRTGAHLTINHSFLSACNNMWAGIKNNGGAVNIDNTSNIYDAKTGVTCDGNGSIVQIQNSTFDKNYTSISLTNGNYQNSYIRGNSFKCTSNFIDLLPHHNEQPPQQILITDATGVKIGEAGNGNILSDAISGIVAERSNVEVYSNTFSNFRYRQGLGVGYAIKAKGDNINQYTLTVGTSAADKNTISDCQMGIYSYLGMNSEIHNNQISFVNYGIIASSSNNRKINIYDNELGNFKGFGIDVSDNHNADVHVERNYINTVLGVPLPYSSATESLKGIYVGNTIQSKPSMTIKENHIYNCRFGIQVINQDNCYITANIIHYQLTDNDILANLNIFRNGIIVQQCYSHHFGFQISYNEVYHDCIGCNTNTTLQSHLRGYSIERSWVVVRDNYATYIPTMLRVYQSCDGTEFHCNVWDHGQQGFVWDAGAHLLSQGDPLDATNNEWTYWIGQKRIEYCNGCAPIFVPWYSDFGLNGGNNDYNPVPFMAGAIFQFNALPNDENCTGLYNGGGGGGHQERLMGMVNDSDFVDNPSEHIYHNRDVVYKQLKDSIELLYAGSVYDANLQNFFTLMALSNTGILDDIQHYLNNNDAASAMLANAGFDPVNLMESNSKLVNTICLQRSGDTITYDSLQRTQLFAIAYQLPLLGGEAVYRARAILKIDVDDTQLEYRLQGKSKSIAASDYSLYPNPNSGTFIIKYLLADNQSGTVAISDGIGNIIQRQSLQPNKQQADFNLTAYSNGIYFVHLITTNSINKIWKVVVIK